MRKGKKVNLTKQIKALSLTKKTHKFKVGQKVKVNLKPWQGKIAIITCIWGEYCQVVFSNGDKRLFCYANLSLLDAGYNWGQEKI
jgi:hypothetical protein